MQKISKTEIVETLSDQIKISQVAFKPIGVLEYYNLKLVEKRGECQINQELTTKTITLKRKENNSIKITIKFNKTKTKITL